MESKEYLKGIKRDIKKFTGIDISKKTNRRDTVFLRAIYCRIALDNTHLSDLEIAETIGRSRTMVLYYGKEVFPQIEQVSEDIYNIYLCLSEGISLEQMEKVKMLNTKQRLKDLEKQIEVIKQLNATSVIDLRSYIESL